MGAHGMMQWASGKFESSQVRGPVTLYTSRQNSHDISLESTITCVTTTPLMMLLRRLICAANARQPADGEGMRTMRRPSIDGTESGPSDAIARPE